MSPLPYLRWQSAALAILIAGAGLLSAATFGACCGIGALAWLFVLREKYRQDRSRTAAAVPAHRARLDRTVTRDSLLMLSPAILLCALFAAGITHSLNHDPTYGAATALPIAAAAIWASSLFDWYVILPRISGQLGARPCRSGCEKPEFPFPRTWKEVTRWWYTHRVIAEFVSRASLAVALALLIGGILNLHDEARVVAVIFTVSLGVYAASALPQGLQQAGHPGAVVGQTVRVERASPTRRRLPPFTVLPRMHLGGRFYVVDVAVGGVQVVDITPHEAEAVPDPPKFERLSDSMATPTIDAIQPAVPRFCGCEQRCSGINWYCIENPRSFEVK